MRDLALWLIFSGLTYSIVRRPWTGVPALAVVAYMHPQGYGEGPMQAFPAYLYVFLLTLTATLIRPPRPWREWPPMLLELARDPRLWLLIAFWAWTTWAAYQAPVSAFAWPRWWAFTKTLAGVGLGLLLIDDRRKFETLILAIALSFSLVALKGGYWALLHGAADRVYGPPGSAYYDNNLFAIANLMTLPLLFALGQRFVSPVFRATLGLLALAALVAALSSWSRGALLAGLALAGVMAWNGRFRLPALGGLALVSVLALGFMPGAWLARMTDIGDYARETSALSRLEIWRIGLENGLQRPWNGWGFDGWRVISDSLDWHSVYVELFVEQGGVGLALWLALVIGLLTVLWRPRKRFPGPSLRWARPYVRALQAGMAAYLVGGAFLGISYWEILYQFMILGILLERQRRALVPSSPAL